MSKLYWKDAGPVWILMREGAPDAAYLDESEAKISARVMQDATGSNYSVKQITLWERLRQFDLAETETA